MILKKLSTVVLTVLMVGVMAISSFANETIVPKLPACPNCDNGTIINRVITIKNVLGSVDCPDSIVTAYRDILYTVIEKHETFCTNCSYSRHHKLTSEKIECPHHIHIKNNKS